MRDPGRPRLPGGPGPLRGPAAVRGAALGALPAAVALLVVPGLNDPFLTPKAALAVAGAGVGTLWWVARAWRRGRLHAAPPCRLRVVLLAVVAVYVAALIAATLAHERPLLAVAGHAGRHTGLAVALAAVVVLLAAVDAGRRAPLASAAPLVVASVPVSGYALVQALGADPVGWELVEGGPPVFSTLGNANFLSGWLGVIAPLAAWAALATTGWWRVAASVAGALALASAVASGSLQGVGAGALTTVGVLVAGVWVRSGRRVGVRVAAVTAALAVVVAGVGAATGAWLGVLTRARASFDNRLELWGVALRLTAEDPWRGVGLGGYRGRFAAHQPAESAAERGLDRVADSPHSVPLELLVSGGWPLLAAWLAVVAAVAAVVLWAWRRGEPDERLATVGLGGAGAAYLLQAAVSIDVAPLALTGGLIAGLAVGHARGGRPRAEVPAFASQAPASASVSALPRAPRAVAVRGGALAAAALAALAVIGAGLTVTADGWVAAAARAGEEERVAHLARAARLAPWEPSYASALGSALVAAGEREAALRAYTDAVARDPRAIAPRLNIGRVAVALDSPGKADAAYAAAVRLHPRTPAVLAEAGRHALDRGRAGEAEELLERAVDGDGGDAAWWRDLADARERLGDDAGAAAARAEARARERRPRSRVRQR